MATETSGNGAFSPEAVAAINGAYEAAIAALDIRSAHSERRAALARIMLDLARAGETDGVRLRERAIAAMKRHERVELRAHEIWEREGRPGGRQDEHWRRAEEEIGKDD